MPCNWKVALEAFIEAYHTMAVHPQLLPTAADSLTEYDVYGPHVSRMITAVGVSSEHLDRKLDDVEIVRAMLGSKDADVAVEPGSSARQALGERIRASLRKRTGSDYSDVTDAELLDGIEYFLFPNFMPWAGFLTSFAYRFRPDGHDPDSCVIDIMVLEPIPAGVDRPPAAATRVIGPGETWADVAELGVFGRVFNQDGSTFGRVQRGLRASVAAHDDVGQLPGEPDPAFPRHPRPLPRGRPLMDFHDSPEEATFRAAFALVARGQQPAPSPVVDLGRVLGTSAGLAPIAPRGGVLRALVAQGSTAGTTAPRSTTSSSTRSSPGPAHHPGPASATSSRRSSGTPTRT